MPPSPPWVRPGLPERVADYPRPPALELVEVPVRLEVGGQVLAASDRVQRVLETFHPPTIYLPPDAFQAQLLRPAAGRSFCEWKGVARYLDVVGAGPTRYQALWCYDAPMDPYGPLAGWLGVYPGRMDACWLGGERVHPQPGNFYGGWITSQVEGPFKGDPRHPELI